MLKGSQRACQLPATSQCFYYLRWIEGLLIESPNSRLGHLKLSPELNSSLRWCHLEKLKRLQRH